LGAFVAELASSAPTPGGGGASALAGALGAALAEMVGQLTVGRPKFQEVEPEVRGALSELEARRAELLRLMDEDAAAYSGVRAAYALPRASDEERAIREAAIQRAVAGAMEPPRRIQAAALDALRLAEVVARVGNPVVASDAGCAAVLAEAAVRCGGLNVLANAVLLHDHAARDAATAEVTARDAQAREMLERALATIHARMGV
ncbi:MAG TPA: cyclodeaminase/cyclohydrolase family protein, partial [Ktedonobacterales bacterium]